MVRVFERYLAASLCLDRPQEGVSEVEIAIRHRIDKGSLGSAWRLLIQLGVPDAICTASQVCHSRLLAVDVAASWMPFKNLAPAQAEA